MTADRPLTRREVRERERALERAAEESTEEPRVESTEEPRVEPAEEPRVSEQAAEPPVPQAPRASRRALREVARQQESTSERGAVRRRPVQAPTTTGLTVVDQATGALSAVSLAPVPEPEPEPTPAPKPRAEPTPAPKPRAEPVPAQEEGAGLRRRSVMGRTEDAPTARPAAMPRSTLPWGGAGDPDSAEEAEPVGRSALATVLRFLVLVVAAFVVGVLIWMVAADVAAAGDAAQAVARAGLT